MDYYYAVLFFKLNSELLKLFNVTFDYNIVI